MVNGIGLGVQTPQVVVVRENEKKKGSGALAQAGNVALTAGGLYGTGKLMNAGGRALDRATYTGEMAKYFPKNGKIGNAAVKFFNKMGEIMFNHPKMEKLLQEAKAQYPNLRPNVKGRFALVTTAGIAALALITRGIYKAGEIAGEHKQKKRFY